MMRFGWGGFGYMFENLVSVLKVDTDYLRKLFEPNLEMLRSVNRTEIRRGGVIGRVC
jgi:hypothetical protein